MTERQRIANLLFQNGMMDKDQWLEEGDITFISDEVSFTSTIKY